MTADESKAVLARYRNEFRAMFRVCVMIFVAINVFRGAQFGAVTCLLVGIYVDGWGR